MHCKTRLHMIMLLLNQSVVSKLLKVTWKPREPSKYMAVVVEVAQCLQHPLAPCGE